MAMRHPHFLTPNHASQLPANCVWFDTETLPEIKPNGDQHHHLWFGWACYQRRKSGGEWEPEIWHRFDTIPGYWDWIETRCRKKTRLTMFSHNGAFDLPVMHAFTELPERGWTLKSAVADAPPLILTWIKEGMTIKFIDTLNIWRMSLDELGKSVGINKLAMPERDMSPEEWDVYCRRDVEVMRLACHAWFTFITDNDLGGFAPTLASQSFNAYRHRFRTAPIFIDDNEDALLMARDSYIGGRTECFRIGHYEQPLFYIDVNSMYPSVMKTGDYPTRLQGVYRNIDDHEIDIWLREKCFVADVTLNTDTPIYPVVNDKRLIFPTGRFKATLATPEFRLAWRRGHIEHVERVAVYEKAKLFAEFVDTIYTLRQAAKQRGDTVNSWLYKILMNSLYGKFGQRGRVFEDIGHCDPNIVENHLSIDADTGETSRIRKFGGLVQELRDDGESRESHPAIASHVTSYARLILWEAIETAGIDHCLYCDTDSLVIDQQGFDKLAHLIDQDRLGAWALEREMSFITLYGPKDYVMPHQSRTKGVRHSAMWMTPNRVVQDQFVGLKGLLQQSNLQEPIVRQVSKTLQRVYLKADVNPLGVTVPFHLSTEIQSR
jgi:hypothetical protein